jgi:hypothetical protein
MITDLNQLMSEMNPVLTESNYAFCSLTKSQREELKEDPLLEFKEKEGITVVITQAGAAKYGFSWEFPSRMITLQVYSSLNAVGFMAAITSRLASRGISVQAVSAFHHDYLFVPENRAEEALEVLLQYNTAAY